ncbi:ATP-binding protein [Dactylosporangium sp. CA-092794]|uniref:ATP-binding protein n=1 Tax=Dactylosporangium sp. CA-092794 TaxID=3239929 RepID=UPI003D941141
MTAPTGGTPAATVPAAAYTAVTTHLIRIQAFTDAGATGISLAGLPAEAAWHTRDRLLAAIHDSGLRRPDRAITLRVFPQPLPVGDSGLDAAFALALLAVDEQVPAAAIQQLAVVAELGLDGQLYPVRGLRERAAAIAGGGFTAAVVAAGDLTHAVRMLGGAVRGAVKLHDLVAALRGHVHLLRPPAWPSHTPTPGIDLTDLRADLPGRRALEVAAAGGHHLLLSGPPGSGTVILAQQLPGLLPALDPTTAGQVAQAYRAAGLLAPDAPVVARPPWQAPHHTISLAALTGTSTRPGAVGLAQGGVLFLDEVGELPTRALEVLRQPLIDGRLQVASGGTRGVQPARIQLVMATRGCPNSAQHPGGVCDCPAEVRHRYLRRLTPVRDHIDLRVTQPGPFPATTGRALPVGESTSVVAAWVAQARSVAAARWRRSGFATNAQAATAALRADLVGRWAALLAGLRSRPAAAHLTFQDAGQVLAVACTLADLAGKDAPGDAELTEAVTLRPANLDPGQVR